MPSIELLAEPELCERAAAEVLGEGSAGSGAAGERADAVPKPSSSPSAAPGARANWAGQRFADVIARLRRPRELLGLEASDGDDDDTVLHYMIGGLQLLEPMLSTGARTELVPLSVSMSSSSLLNEIHTSYLISTEQERIKWRQLQGLKIFTDTDSELFRYSSFRLYESVRVRVVAAFIFFII